MYFSSASSILLAYLGVLQTCFAKDLTPHMHARAIPVPGTNLAFTNVTVDTSKDWDWHPSCTDTGRGRPGKNLAVFEQTPLNASDCGSAADKIVRSWTLGYWTIPSTDFQETQVLASYGTCAIMVSILIWDNISPWVV
jgi:hypothetical protein